MKQGLIYVFTGEGKGKTSAAIGTVVRAVGAGMNVAWVGFYKEATWKLAEVEPLKKLGVEIKLMGLGFALKGPKTRPIANEQIVVDKASNKAHQEAAKKALKTAAKYLGEIDLLVLDEVNNAVADKLIDLNDLLELISKRGRTHLVITGRWAAKELIEAADLVTDMKKMKHPYDSGRLAVRGLDF